MQLLVEGGHASSQGSQIFGLGRPFQAPLQIALQTLEAALRGAELLLEPVEAIGEPGGIGLGAGNLALEAVEARTHNLVGLAAARDERAVMAFSSFASRSANLGCCRVGLAHPLLQSLQFGSQLGIGGTQASPSTRVKASMRLRKPAARRLAAADRAFELRQATAQRAT